MQPVSSIEMCFPAYSYEFLMFVRGHINEY
jgi:hypothetical protein